MALDTPEVYCQWPVAENVRLRFIAKPRRRGQGYRRLPSFNLAAPPPLPPLQFDDGTAGQLEDLEIGIVQQLASGHRRLAIEQVSHREVWKTVAESMIAAGCISTSELDALEREVRRYEKRHVGGTCPCAR